MTTQINGWHIELTRRCPLVCPACNRTVKFDSMVIDPSMDIEFDVLKTFFNDTVIKQSNFVLLQGNLGDPIYHPRFHDIAELFFDVDALSTITNGMHNIHFWERALATWPANSKITLSIDGLADTNAIYRVNSKWATLQRVLDLISKTPRKCTLNWKFIVFEHNKHQVQDALQLSKKLGFDEFQIQRSRKFSNNTISPYYGADIFDNEVALDQFELDPYCFSGDIHYINAAGDYYPCCWWPDTNSESGWWEPINIASNSAEQCNDHFNKFKKSIVWEHGACPKVCSHFCKKQSKNYIPLMPNTQLGRKVIKHG